jgi:hypothetical protein
MDANVPLRDVTNGGDLVMPARKKAGKEAEEVVLDAESHVRAGGCTFIQV